MKKTQNWRLILFSFILLAFTNAKAVLQITPNITPACQNDGAVTFSYTGGSGTPLFSLYSAGTAFQQQSSPTFNGLAAGSYYLILSTATDSADISFTIPSVIKLQSTVTPISCSNTSNITVSVTGGTPSYNYQWSNGATTQNINAHTPGFYYLTVTDANQCSTTLKDSVGQNVFSTYISSIGLPTCGAADGAITVSTSLGLAPYTYQWTNNVSNSASATNLSVGNYAVTVTDANGCSTTNSVNLFSNVQITPTVTPECTPGSGALTCNLACSNSGVHHYTLYNNLTGSITRQSSPTFPNLTSGSYTLVVGGVDSGFVTVTIPSTLSVNTSSTDINCPIKGSIQTTVTGGIAPYSYIWSNGATTASITNLSQGGIYSYTVEDANGCKAIGYDSLIENSSFQPNIIKSGSVCQPVFTSTPSGGTAPYSYLWSNGSTSNSITNLTPGTSYFLTVTDANGCRGFEYKFNAFDSTFNWMIDSVSILPVSSCNGSLGSIRITKLLGQAPHTFLWSNGQTTSSINTLQSGYYTVTVTDAGGCSGKMTFYVSYSGNYVSGGFDTVLHTTCGGNTGKIHLSPYGGTAPYTYQWTNSSSTTNTAENLTPGGYSVTITDAAGCSAVYVTTINGIATFNEQITTTPNDCDLSIYNGTATVNVSGGGTPPFSYEWYSVNTYIGNTQTVTNLAAYKWVFVKVRDAQGCIAHDSVATFTMPDTSCGGICHAHFSIQPDPNTAHNWIVDNTSSSAHVLNYFWYWGDGSYSAGVSPSHTYSTPGYFNICLHVSDSTGCVDSYCDSSTYVFKTDEIITVNVVDKTAISTFIEKPTEEKQFMVFPNPSNGIFNIQLPVEVDNKDVNLNVTNLLGEVVFSQKMTQQNTTLDITQQPKGIYIISFQGIDGLINKKLIKE